LSGTGTAITFAGNNNLSPVQDVANPFSLNSLTFDPTAGLFVLSGSPLSLASAIGMGHPTAVAQNSISPETIAEQLTGNPVSSPLVKSGTGTLILTNTTNNYAGGTFVSAGTLSVGAAGAVIPANSSVTVSGGATFQIGFASGDTEATPIGTLTLNGGTLRVPNGTATYAMNRLVTGTAGGTVDLSGMGSYGGIGLIGTGAGMTIGGNTSFLGNGAGNAHILGGSGATVTITPGVTLTTSVPLAGGGTGFLVTGGGTFYFTSFVSFFVAPITVNQGRVRVNDLSDDIGGTVLGSSGNFTLNGGALQHTGPSQSTPFPIIVGPNGGTLEIADSQTTLTLSGAITGIGSSGPGPLTKAGPGTLVLTNTSNNYAGGITVAAGVLAVGSDAQLGLASLTVNAPGTLRYTASAATARTFNLSSGRLEAASGVTLTLNGAAVNGGYLAGAGSFAVTGGTILSGTTTTVSSTLAVTGPASFVDFTNGGAFTVAAVPSAPASFNQFTNQGSGTITVGAASKVNAADFQTYGSLTLNPGSMAVPTQLTNTGTSPLYFNGGSRTFIATPQTAGQFLAGLDLNGKNAVVAGGLFVNNGYVIDGTGGSATVVADFGSLVKGAGFYQNGVITINGGKFQAGNSPGVASFGKFVLGPGGVNNYVFAIDDATGVAGPSPDALGQVSGWGFVRVGEPPVFDRGLNGDFTWTATPTAKLIVALETLVNPTLVGVDVPGPMDHFDSTRSYVWPAVEWAGSYAGPADAAALDAATSFDAQSFANPIFGSFGWQLDRANQTLSVVYTPTAVPEPGGLVLLATASLCSFLPGRRWFGAR
jgi:autotransporter-associated beta strand protein